MKKILIVMCVEGHVLLAEGLIYIPDQRKSVVEQPYAHEIQHQICTFPIILYTFYAKNAFMFVTTPCPKCKLFPRQSYKNK